MTEDEGWECSDCGWGVNRAQLLPGWSLDDAREVHQDRYCGEPPTW